LSREDFVSDAEFERMVESGSLGLKRDEFGWYVVVLFQVLSLGGSNFFGHIGAVDMVTICSRIRLCVILTTDTHLQSTTMEPSPCPSLKCSATTILKATEKTDMELRYPDLLARMTMSMNLRGVTVAVMTRGRDMIWGREGSAAVHMEGVRWEDSGRKEYTLVSWMATEGIHKEDIPRDMEEKVPCPFSYMCRLTTRPLICHHSSTASV
jgi:hypothetical protein